VWNRPRMPSTRTSAGCRCAAASRCRAFQRSTAASASAKPLIEVARASKKADALAAVERWKARHREAAAHLQPADVLVDGMRGRFHTWTRIRINLEHVPEALRPAQEPLEIDEVRDEWEGKR
jgi:bifunctional non-homologous end joining protein LigD